MNVVPFRKPRTLATVLAEIDATRREITQWDAAYAADPAAYESRGDDYRVHQADERLTSLQGEALTLVRDALGVSFSDLEARLS